MKPWVEEELINLKGYKGKYLNRCASTRFYNLYKDIISIMDNKSYISLEDAEKIYEEYPRKVDFEIYTIVKKSKPITDNSINKIKCSALMGVGIMCFLTMLKNNKSKEDICNNLSKTFNQYINDNDQFNLIKNKIPNFYNYFENLSYTNV